MCEINHILLDQARRQGYIVEKTHQSEDGRVQSFRIKTGDDVLADFSLALFVRAPRRGNRAKFIGATDLTFGRGTKSFDAVDDVRRWINCWAFAAKGQK